MTAYQGGKGRLGKKISEIIRLIEEDFSVSNSTYIEPFCGMCGVMFHVAARDGNREIIANDANGDVIQMWRQLQEGWDPPSSCSREEFSEMKHNDRDIPDACRGFLGSVSSYGNIFMGYYRLHLQPNHRNYVEEGRTRILNIVQHFKNSSFIHGPYENIDVRNAFVYCDPPYIKNGFKTNHFQGFDHVRFWGVMRKWSKISTVLISERTAPDDFKCVWSLDRHFSINKQSLTKSTECLFVHESIFLRLSKDVREKILNV